MPDAYLERKYIFINIFTIISATLKTSSLSYKSKTARLVNCLF